MTPEEKADALIESWQRRVWIPTLGTFRAMIVAAIDSAVAAERERCAKIVSDFAIPENDVARMDGQGYDIDQILSRIRDGKPA